MAASPTSNDFPITIATAWSGCEVWTTVSSADKRNYLMSKFTDLKRENIGHSRSQSFVKTVMNGTKGKGVDIVLNSLSGRFLSISTSSIS